MILPVNKESCNDYLLCAAQPRASQPIIPCVLCTFYCGKMLDVASYAACGMR